MRFLKSVSAIAYATLLLTACTSRKELTDSTALDMVREYMKPYKFMVGVPALKLVENETLTDYSRPTSSSEASLILKELIDHHLLSQSARTVDYAKLSPELTGSYTDTDGQVMTETFKLSNNNDPTVITGERVLTNKYGQSDSFTASGTLSADGRAELKATRGMFTWAVEHGSYGEDGNTAHLDMDAMRGAMFAREGHPAFRLSGRATGEKTHVPWYTYTVPADVKQKLVLAQNGEFLPCGDFKIDSVSI